MLNFFEIYVGVCVCVCISVCVCVYLCVCVYGVTVPQPTVERVSQSEVTWPNICHISVAECRRQKNQKHPA